MPDIVFSDIDGTCVHYDMGETLVPFCAEVDFEGETPLGLERAEFQKDDARAWVLALPESSSGSRGIISVDTLKAYARLQDFGCRVILVSGCRCSTLIQRIPYLPQADAYVCESGGRIFYPAQGGLSLVEDLVWRNAHSSLPPVQPSTVAPETYSGDLWEFYRNLKSKGINIDSKNYSTAFRVKDKRVSGQDVPSSLAYSTNLGSLDIYPKTSGKLNAAIYLMNKFSSGPESSVFMCDDDNDIELALHVSRAYLPGITSESMQKTVEENRNHFYVAKRNGIWGTEEVLSEIMSTL